MVALGFILIIVDRGRPRDHADDRELIGESIRSNAQYGTINQLAAWATAYIEIEEETALDFIREQYVENVGRSSEEVKAILMALSVHGNNGHTQLRDRIVAAYRTILENHPAMAPQMVSDLTAWKRWDLAAPVAAIVAAPASFLPGGRGDHLFGQRIIMCAVGAAVVVLVGYLAREVAGRKVGLTAAVLAAVYPGLWINDGLVMAESLTVLGVTGLLYTAARYRRGPTARLAAWLGVWIAFATLARAESLLLVPLVVLPLLWVSHPTWRDRVVRTMVAGLVTVVILAPWVGANLVRFEEPVLLSHGDGLVLIGSNNDAVYDGGGLGFWLAPAEVLDSSSPARVGSRSTCLARATGRSSPPGLVQTNALPQGTIGMSSKPRSSRSIATSFSSAHDSWDSLSHRPTI